MPCSDDSSTSSLQDTLERKSPPKPSRRISRDGNSTSDDEGGSEDDTYKHTSRRRIARKELILRDTVPSSWKYSPGIPRKEYHSQQAVITNGNCQLKKFNESQLITSRLPSLTPRSENKQPPKVSINLLYSVKIRSS